MSIAERLEQINGQIRQAYERRKQVTLRQFHHTKFTRRNSLEFIRIVAISTHFNWFGTPLCRSTASMRHRTWSPWASWNQSSWFWRRTRRVNVISARITSKSCSKSRTIRRCWSDVRRSGGTSSVIYSRTSRRSWTASPDWPRCRRSTRRNWPA